MVKWELRFDLSNPLHLHLFQGSLHHRRFLYFSFIVRKGFTFLCRNSVKHCYWLCSLMFSQRKYWEIEECVSCLSMKVKSWIFISILNIKCSSLTSFSLHILYYVLLTNEFKCDFVNSLIDACDKKWLCKQRGLWTLNKAALFVLKNHIVWFNCNGILRLHYLRMKLLSLS